MYAEVSFENRKSRDLDICLLDLPDQGWSQEDDDEADGKGGARWLILVKAFLIEVYHLESQATTHEIVQGSTGLRKQWPRVLIFMIEKALDNTAPLWGLCNMAAENCRKKI